MFVVLKNLLSRHELNGVEAIVQAVMPETGRLQVKTALNTVCSVAATNLDVIAHPRAVWACRCCQVNAYWSKTPEAGRTWGQRQVEVPGVLRWSHCRSAWSILLLVRFRNHCSRSILVGFWDLYIAATNPADRSTSREASREACRLGAASGELCV